MACLPGRWYHPGREPEVGMTFATRESEALQGLSGALKNLDCIWLNSYNQRLSWGTMHLAATGIDTR